MRPEKKAIQIELEAEEKLIVELLQKHGNTMELSELKIRVALSGKKWDKAMKTLAQHGLTSVSVNGDSKIVALKE